ncbi:MAG: carbon-nitrogen hydrolase [candidate division Zixibacteria bacterium]|nr:carbon-nitrogen hydrolase [candidate division Zixibacteria bacterium]
MKIGFVQMRPVLGDTAANIKKITSLIEDIGDADLVVLPELCNSGYNFKTGESAFKAAEEVNGSQFIRRLEELCKQFNFHIVSGFNERDNDRLYNTAVLVGPGGYIGKYRKLHLFLNEKDLFAPGDVGLPVFDIGTCKIGMLICFDWIFPEVWRVLALKGADIICHPSNLVIPGLCQRAVPIHAVTNRVFVVTANRIGDEDDLTFTGLSIIADPRGEVLSQASSDREETAAVEVDISKARDKNATARNHLFDDRRPEEYNRINKK